MGPEAPGLAYPYYQWALASLGSKESEAVSSDAHPAAESPPNPPPPHPMPLQEPGEGGYQKLALVKATKVGFYRQHVQFCLVRWGGGMSSSSSWLSLPPVCPP